MALRAHECCNRGRVGVQRKEDQLTLREKKGWNELYRDHDLRWILRDRWQFKSQTTGDFNLKMCKSKKLGTVGQIVVCYS